MKKFVIVIFIYSIISLVLLTLISIPPKLDEEKLDVALQVEQNKTSQYLEERFPNLPAEIREEAAQDSRNTIKGLYKETNTFSYRFKNNLKAYGIGLVILIVVMLVRGLHYNELYRG